MNPHVGSMSLCAAFLCCAGTAEAAVCAPAKLVHLVTVDVTPGVPAASFGAQPRVMYRIGSEQIAGSSFDVYRIDGGTDAVEILERSGTSTPSFVRYYRQGKLLEAIRYDLYVTGLPNDPALFVPPSGVQYSEAGTGS